MKMNRLDEEARKYIVELEGLLAQARKEKQDAKDSLLSAQQEILLYQRDRHYLDPAL